MVAQWEVPETHKIQETQHQIKVIQRIKFMQSR